MKIAFITLLTAILVGSAPAQLASERVWTGVNDKSFSGAFHRLSPDIDFVLCDLDACRVLPLRIAWENPLDATIKEEYHRVRMSGNLPSN